MSPEIVFVSNDASETGAPQSLHTFVRWLVEHGKARPRIVLAGGGPLERSFAELGPVYRTWQGEDPATRGILALSRRASWRLHRRSVLDALARAGRRWQPALVYANTVTTGHEMAAIRRDDVPVITHVRELGSLFPAVEQTGNIGATLRFTRRFVANSQATKDHFVRRYAVPPARVDVVHPFIDDRPEANPEATDEPRALPNVDAGSRLVVGCGTLHRRKGVDLFVDVAAAIAAKGMGDGLRFVWVGGDTTQMTRDDAARDVARRGLSGIVSFVGHRSDHRRFLAQADLLLLTSREEPFGRVVLEAALFGKPTICFAESGGAPEFVRDDAGRVVPCGDVEAMARATIELLRSAATREALGACARSRVLREHSVDRGATRLWDIVERVLDERPAARTA